MSVMSETNEVVAVKRNLLPLQVYQEPPIWFSALEKLLALTETAGCGEKHLVTHQSRECVHHLNSGKKLTYKPGMIGSGGQF